MKPAALLLGLLGVSVCGACAAGGAHRATIGPEERDTVASPHRVVEVRYTRPGQASAGAAGAVVDVISAGSSHVRVHLTTDHAERLLVYDGRRLLVHEPGATVPYQVYAAPARHPRALAAVRSWRLDPDSEDFARLCRGAEKVARASTIAGRSAVGYSCGAPKHRRGGAGALWLDRETGVLLRSDAFEAREVTFSTAVDASTFSTEPPRGAGK